MKTPVHRLLPLTALLCALPAAAQTAPGQTPDYFGVFPNYASSPLPVQSATATSTVVGNALIDRTYATDNAANVFVVLPTPLPAGTLQSFQTRNQATAGGSFAPSAGLGFHAYVLRPTATANQYSVVFDSGLLTVPALTTAGVSEIATFPASVAVQAGDVLAFYGQGVPLDIGSGSDTVFYPVPTAPVLGTGTLDLSGAAAGYPILAQARTYSFGATVSVSTPGLSGGMVKFKDALPDLVVAKPDTTCSDPNADCYTIKLKEVSWQFHADLPPTKVRGYVWVKNGVEQPFQYLGPVVLAQKDRPVRVTFTNELPTGTGGDLFIPVDTTYMGAGPGPNGGSYTQNRASIHLHGGTTPWISDGTIHQWTTPSGENTLYPKGVSVYNVPDMPGSGDSNTAPQGTLTFYYTNQQSARLMFYHDHALGITRLNVYAGEAAGYLVTDPTEQDMIARAVLPGIGIPLVIQDRTFVPESTQSPDPRTGTAQPFTNLLGTFPSQLAAQDPTWNVAKWGGFGSLWFPHVYMPNQNPGDLSGANAMGRWDYGPWFWPPFTNLAYGPVANPYYNPACASSSQTYCEGPQIPGTPDSMLSASGVQGPSGVPESFMDTPVVNGKAYPTLTVPAGKVRFRILNAANDRYWNLSFFVADPGATYPAGYSGPGLSEVKMVPFDSTQNSVKAFPSWWYDSSVPNPFDGRVGGVPDPDTRGPAMIQIATDGGWLPSPAVILNQPVNYVMNKRDITVGNVKEKALFLGPAERADIVVDFTKFAGKTLILYNDSPAPVPAADPRLDYFTGDPDQTDTGGAPSTLAGYGPNTRTVLRITVDPNLAGSNPAPSSTAPVDDYDPAYLTTLQTELPKAFLAVQDPIIVPQAPYNSVYGCTNFPGDASAYVKIQDTKFTFSPLGDVGSRCTLASPITVDMFPKSLIEDFQTDYGRMNAILGNEIPNTNVTNQTSIPQTLVDPPVELVKLTDPGVSTSLIGTAADGTQIWKFTHNGVDTHAIHFHMFNVQVLNRVGWDGAIKPPDANELGFKDTVRMNPLEDLIVATRAIRLTNMPFKIPNSIRLLDPTQPLGAATGFTNVDPSGNPVTVTNQLANFGWEYVYHCHLLGHEENDMMRPLVVAAPPEAPTLSSATFASSKSGPSVALAWANNSLTASGYTIQRDTDPAFAAPATLATVGNVTTYSDGSPPSGTTAYYRIIANNTVGSSVPGYPTLTATSAPSNVLNVVVPAGPAAPTNLAATLVTGPRVRLTWTNVANNATGIRVETAADPAGPWTVLASLGRTATNYTTGVVTVGTSYYRVSAFNANGVSPSNVVTVVVALPAAPTGVTVTTAQNTRRVDSNTVTWSPVAGATGYRVQRSSNGAFTANLQTTNVTATQLTQNNLSRNTYYYYRVAAVSVVGQSAWTNATPFPIRTLP